MTKGGAMDSENLKLLKIIAKDLEDLSIMASHIQDSIIPLMSMDYDPKAQMFRATLNRFCWEHGEKEHEGEPLYHRVHSSLEIHRVKKVLHKGIDRKGEHRSHNLLTLLPDEENAIHLVFSGGPEIRVEVEGIHLHLGDLHHPWPTRKKPKHIHEHLED
jgi:hypothetical protein